MKKLLLLVLFASVALFAQAQKNNKTPEERAQSKTDKLAEKLTLDESQKEEVYALLLEQGANRVDGKKMRDLSKEERMAFMEERKAKRVAFDAKMEEILTTEQYTTYKEKRHKSDKKKMKGHGKKGHAGKGGRGKGNRNSKEGIQKRVDKMTEQLALTPAQQTQLHALYTEHQSNKPEKGAFKNMSEEDRAAAKEARKNAKAALDTNLQEILSAEQYTTYQQLKNDRSSKRKAGKKGKKGKEFKGNKKANEQ